MSIRHLPGTVVLAASFLLCAPVSAQDEVSPDPGMLPADTAADFDARLAALAALEQDVQRLGERLDDSEGIMAEVFRARLDSTWIEMFDSTVSLARDVASEAEQGRNVSAYIDRIEPRLRSLPARAVEATDRLEANIRFPDPGLAPAERVVADQKLLRATGELDRVYSALVSYVEIAEKVGVDPSEERDDLVRALSESAANRSVYLQLALDDVSILRGATSTLPENTELPPQLRATEARVRIASASLQTTVDLLTRLGVETREYRAQILKATGALTTDVLDVGVVGGLISEWTSDLFGLVRSDGPRLLFSVFLVAIIVLVFFWLGKIAQQLVSKALQASKVNFSSLLERMVVSMVRNIVIFVGLLIALSQIGISLGPLLAGLGIAGFIIGFALQDSLSNFASGMLILIYRPFDVGDYVNAGGVAGTVDRMSLVNTTFKTIDNQVLVVPNNMIWQSVITNVTAQDTRRIDMTFGISYGDDIDKAKAILADVVNNYETVLPEPEPVIQVHELGDSSVNLILRPWVKTEDYWPTFWNLTEIVKKRFDEGGITIPFPQRDVHMHESKAD